jgi:GNAT superfamily N-acetyltransferase
MIKLLTPIDIYKYANSGDFELLRESLLNMGKDSYDNKELYSTYGYYENNKLIGLFSIKLKDKVIPDALHLGLIEINNNIKGRGFGSKLMNEIIDLSKKSGFNFMTLRAHDQDRLEFYYKFGFNLTSSKNHPYLFMIKDLS